MTKLTVCIGSSCYLKGADDIIEELKNLINEYGVKDKIEFCGSFCMGKCANSGVSVTLNDVFYSLKVEDVRRFFTEKVLKSVV